MENNLQIIQYDGKIAIVNMDAEIKKNINVLFKEPYSNSDWEVRWSLEEYPATNFCKKLLAHSPHIDGVADIIVESEDRDKLIEQIQPYCYCYLGSGMLSNTVDEDVAKNYANKILDIIQNKQNTYTEEQMRKLLNESFEYLTVHTKDEFDEFINKKFQQLNQKQYEFVRIDEQGNYVIKEK